MNKIAKVLPALVSFFTALAPLHAQVSVNTNFTTGYFNSGDGYGPAGESSLDGAPTNAPASEQWQTTDSYNPVTDTGSTSLMVYTPGWSYGTALSGNQTVWFGNYDPAYESEISGNFGILPGVTNPVLYREFSPGVPGAPLDLSVTWTADFGIINLNDPAFPYDDVFGFNLLDSTQTFSLAQFSFNPSTASLTNGLRFEWYKDGSLQPVGGAQPNNFDIQYGALYRLTATLSNSLLDLSISGLVAQTNGVGTVTNYSVVTNVNLINAGALSGGFTAIDFATAAVNWELASGDTLQPGANYMLLNSMSVVSSAIPESSTWATGAVLLGLVGFMLWRRKSAACVVRS